MGCGVYWTQIRELERTLGSLRQFGILETSDAYRQLNALRGKLMKQVGFKFPRALTLVTKLAGLSPGVLKLFHDVESGFMSEARAKPGAPPVYHYMDYELAATILKGELTHEQFEQLVTPDDYTGE